MVAVIAPQYDHGVVTVQPSSQSVEDAAGHGVAEADAGQVGLHRLFPSPFLDDEVVLVRDANLLEAESSGGNVVEVIRQDLRQLATL